MYYSNNSIVQRCFYHENLDVNSCIRAKFTFFKEIIVVNIFKFKSQAVIHRISND